MPGVAGVAGVASVAGVLLCDVKRCDARCDAVKVNVLKPFSKYQRYQRLFATAASDTISSSSNVASAKKICRTNTPADGWPNKTERPDRRVNIRTESRTDQRTQPPIAKGNRKEESKEN